MNRNRIASIVFLAVSLAWAPWWVTVAAVVGFIIVFPDPFEALAAAYIADNLYGTRTGSFAPDHAFLVVSSVLMLASYWIRDRMRVAAL
jgi:hypothetical protein